MRKAFAIVLSAAALACSNPAAAPSAPAGASRVAVSGTITAAANGAPIANVRIQVVGGPAESATSSDDAGHYRLADVAAGTVTLRFTASEFADLQRTEAVRAGTTINVQLEKKGLVLSGRITTQWGEPIGDVGVEAVHDGRVFGGGTSATHGTYRIPTLPAMDYVVRAIKWGYVTPQRPLTVSGDTTLDFVLDRTRVSIAGAVREAASCGGPIENARVEIVSGPDVGTAASSSASGYVMKDINWGRFTLRASKPGYAPVDVSLDVLSPGSSCFSCPFVNAPMEVRQDFTLQRTGSC